MGYGIEVRDGVVITFFQCKHIEESFIGMCEAYQLPEAEPLFDPNRKVDRRVRTRTLNLGLLANRVTTDMRRF